MKEQNGVCQFSKTATPVWDGGKLSVAQGSVPECHARHHQLISQEEGNRCYTIGHTTGHGDARCVACPGTA